MKQKLTPPSSFCYKPINFKNFNNFDLTGGQSYKANFGINYIKNGPNKLNFTLNYLNFDVISDKKVL